MASHKHLQTLRQGAFHQQDGYCYYCGFRMWCKAPTELTENPVPIKAWRKLKCTAEHRHARCDGGRDTAENIVAACARCNRNRHKLPAKPEPEAFSAWVTRQVSKENYHSKAVHQSAGILHRRSA